VLIGIRNFLNQHTRVNLSYCNHHKVIRNDWGKRDIWDKCINKGLNTSPTYNLKMGHLGQIIV
ncbi:hypothetical protein D7251_12665, partial [Legionella pneumophila]